MPFTKFSNLDFDQIKTSIKDYLRANSNFTDFDFEGSNFAVLIDTLAYNTYVTAFNANLVVNESFLESATVRENVVSLARNVGYVPASRTAANAVVNLSLSTAVETNTITLREGLVATGSAAGTNYVFSIPENVTTSVVNGVGTFEDLIIREGTFLTKTFTVDGSLDQRFLLDNSFIDTSTIRVYVKGVSDPGRGRVYNLVDNIFDVNSESEIFLIQEVQDEKYELLFGDGIFGKKLENEAVITVTYIVTDGREGNGANNFAFAGTVESESGFLITDIDVTNLTTVQASANGTEIESVQSIKNFAPRLYESQYRAVTAGDYETIIKSIIYPNAESVSVVGGEELTPPRFGNVVISIKPRNGFFVSEFDKQNIKNSLRQYSTAGVNVDITDLKILFVELQSFVYFNSSKVANVGDLRTSVINSLNQYSASPQLNAFGGRFKYSQVQQVIDNTNIAITSNITRVRIRRNLKALINTQANYEICYGNRFHINSAGKNIKSTGFKIPGESSTVYLTDTPNPDGMTGIISIVKQADVNIGAGQTMGTEVPVVIQSAGTVNYMKGEILLNTLTVIETELPEDVIQIQAFPESNDIIGLKDLYLAFDVSESEINMVKDVIASGDDISGVVFSTDAFFRSSYSNGILTRS